jgi:hypothetical protein
VANPVPKVARDIQDILPVVDFQLPNRAVVSDAGAVADHRARIRVDIQEHSDILLAVACQSTIPAVVLVVAVAKLRADSRLAEWPLAADLAALVKPAQDSQYH